jgi:hypothetical protein
MKKSLLILLITFSLFFMCENNKSEKNNKPSPVIANKSAIISTTDSISKADRHNNLFSNAGFEYGKLHWCWLEWSEAWAPYKITDELAHSGTHSALLPLRSEGESRPTVVWGVVQKVIVGKEPPDCLEGFFYIKNWKRGTGKQYLQVAVINESHTLFLSTAQIRYILTGVTEVPYKRAGNVKYIFLEKNTEPLQNTWLKFKMNPTDDFLRAWGRPLQQGDTLKVFFEARYDDLIHSTQTASTDVYYDDLYFGSSKIE